ncbi:efflux RND transporter periplasmic adaptor subunit [Candidatus Chlorohelix sp.]|uniref:efflux RND transporter periplasmic adaptor subunit n=1 Tax=Candidatus Chlorohelix sp. TaxID=3139201 RepID=UPI00305A1FE3
MDEEKGIVPETRASKVEASKGGKKAATNADIKRPGELATSGADSGVPASKKISRLGKPVSKRKQRKVLPWLVAMVVLAGAGAASYFIWFNNSQNSNAIPAQTSTVSASSIVGLSVTSTGQVQAKADLTLTFGAGGTVTQVLLKQGDTVKKGDVLAKIDDRDLQTAVTTAQASLNSAKANYDKLKVGATDIDLQKAQEQLKQAQISAQKTRSGNALPTDIKSAQAQVESAKARLALDKQGGSDYDKAAAQASVSSAQANLSSAQAKLDTLLAGPDAATISAAQVKYDQAVSSLDKTKSNLYASVVNAQVSRDQSLNALKTAQDSYSSIYNNNHNPDGTIKSGVKDADITKETTAQRTLQDAQGAYNKADVALNDAKVNYDAGIRNAQSSADDAKVQLDKVKAGPTAADISTARASVDQATASLNNAQSSLAKLTPTDSTIASDQASLDSALANLAKLTSGGTASDIEVADSNVKLQELTLQNLKNGTTSSDLAVAQSQLDSAQANFDKAKAQLTNALIVAPFDGIISSLPLVVGQVVGASTTAAQIVDISELHADVNVGESDIAKIKLGMGVTLNFDSIANRSFTGKVTFISPKAVVQSNVVSYLVTVTMDGQGKNSLQDAYPDQYQKYLAAIQQNLRQGRPGAAATTDAAQSPGVITPEVAQSPSATTAGGQGRQGGQGTAGRQGGQGANAVGTVTGAVGTPGTTTGGQSAAAGAAQFQAQTAQLRTQLGFCGYIPSFGGGNQQQIQPKIGMTSSVIFCLDVKAGVLSVPTRAIKTETVDGKVNRYVQVQDTNGSTVKKSVTLGLQGDSATEVTGGDLKEGDKVVLTVTVTTRTNTNNAANPFGGTGGGAIPGGGGRAGG